MPDRSHVAVEFDHKTGLCKAFYDRRERYDTAAGERFYQYRNFAPVAFKPKPHVWDEPSLAPGVPERASLWYLGNVNGGNW